MFNLSCIYEGHGSQEIFRFCLNRFCRRRKVCQTCFLNFHNDHQNCCVDDEFIETILQNEVQRLGKIITQIESCQNLEQMKKEEFLQIIRNDRNIYNSCLQDVQQLENGLDFILGLAIKSYNNLMVEELLNLIFTIFLYDQRQLNQLTQIINKQYDYEPEEYLQKKMFELGKTLFRRAHFKDTLLILDSILQIKVKQEYLVCKGTLLLNLNREGEAFIIFCQAHNLAKSLGQDIDFKLILSLFRSTQEIDVKVAIAQAMLHSQRYQECLNHIQQIEFNSIANDRYVILIEIYGMAFDEILACCLAKLKQYSEALQICAIGLQKLPDNDYLKKIQNVCLKLVSRNSEELLNLREEDDGLKLLQGIYLAKEKKNLEALRKFGSIKKGDSYASNFVECLKAEQLIQDKRIEEGVKILDNANFQGDPIMERYLQMKKLLALKQYPEAEVIVDSLLRDYPTKKYIYYSKCFLCKLLLGEILKITHQYDRAVNCLDIVIRQYPTDWRLQFVKVTFLSLASKFDEAIEQIERLLEIEQNFDILELKGKILAHKGDANKALEVFNKLCANFPRNYKCFSDRGDKMHYQLGILLLSLGKLDEAMHDFEAGRNMNQTDHPIIYNIGVIQLSQKQFFQAKQTFQSILFFQKSHLYYGYLLFLDNQYNELLELTLGIKKGQKYFSGILAFKCFYSSIQQIVFYSYNKNMKKLLKHLIPQRRSIKIFFLKIKVINIQQLVISLLRLEKLQKALEIAENQIIKQKNLEIAFFFKGFFLQKIKGYILEHYRNFNQALEFYNKSLNLVCTPNCVAAKVNLLNRMQKFQEAHELQVIFFNVFPGENLEMGLQFKLHYSIQTKVFTGPLNFDLDSGKIMWELQMN